MRRGILSLWLLMKTLLPPCCLGSAPHLDEPRCCFHLGLCRSLQAGGTARGRIHGPASSRMFQAARTFSPWWPLSCPLGLSFCFLVQDNSEKWVEKLEKKMVQKKDGKIRSFVTCHAPTKFISDCFHCLIRPLS